MKLLRTLLAFSAIIPASLFGAGQAVTVQNDGTGKGTFNTAGITSYYVGAPTTFASVNFNTITVGQTLATIAALRAVPITSAILNGYAVQVVGYYAANDGGGGTYVWNSASTAVDNGGTVIQATGIATGRWLLQYDGPINVRWFGAHGDGVTDDLFAFNAAIAALGSTSNLGSYTPTPVHILFVPRGVYALSNRIFIQGDNIAVKGEGAFSTRLKYTGGAIIQEVVKFCNAQYCELSDVGLDGGMPENPTRSETYGANSCLACDLTPFFTCKNVYLTNARLRGLIAIHLWESYFENLQIRNSGFFSDATQAGTGAGINFSNDPAQKESSNALGAGYESNNTTFVKCTLVPVGCLVKCDAPTQNISFITPITENRDFTSFFYALGETKWNLNSADNFLIDGGYCYGHEHPFVSNATLFGIVAQSPGVRIQNYSVYAPNPTGGYSPEITKIFNVDPVYPVTFDNLVVNDQDGALSAVTPFTISTNGPTVQGSIVYKCPSIPTAASLFSGTSLNRWNGKIKVYNSTNNTHQSYDYRETELRYDYVNGAGILPSLSARAWVVFNGATATILASYNVTSVVRNAAGNYTVNFTTSFPDANYVAIANGNASSAQTDRAFVGGQTQTNMNVINGTGATLTDATVMTVVVFK